MQLKEIYINLIFISKDIPFMEIVLPLLTLMEIQTEYQVIRNILFQ